MKKTAWALLILVLAATRSFAHYADGASTNCNSACNPGGGTTDYSVVLVAATPAAVDADPYNSGYYICQQDDMGVTLNTTDTHDRMVIQAKYKPAPLVTTQSSDDCVSGTGNPILNASETFWAYKLKFDDHRGTLPTVKTDGYVDDDTKNAGHDKYTQLSTIGDTCKIGNQWYCGICACDTTKF